MTLTTQERDLLDQHEDLSDNEKAVVGNTMNELNRVLRIVGVRATAEEGQDRVEAALIRFLLDARPDAAKQAPGKPTNVEFVADLMEHSRFGPLVQLFVMDALAKYSKHIAESTVEELEKNGKWGFMTPQAWIDVAKEVSDKMEKRLS